MPSIWSEVGVLVGIALGHNVAFIQRNDSYFPAWVVEAPNRV